MKFELKNKILWSVRLLQSISLLIDCSLSSELKPKYDKSNLNKNTDQKMTLFVLFICFCKSNKVD